MVSLIIVAAGESRRFKNSLPKPFFYLGGKPIIVHTLLAFSDGPLADEIILAVPPNELKRTKEILAHFSLKADKIVIGGKRRQDSVASGLKEVSPRAQIILVHDGARPLVKKELIEKVIKEAELSGAAIPAIPCEDTIKEAEKENIIRTTFNRRYLWAAQTPQGFKRKLILSAYEKAKTAEFCASDEAGLVERLGHPVKIVEGSKENIKITTPLDLLFAEAILKRQVNN